MAKLRIQGSGVMRGVFLVGLLLVGVLTAAFLFRRQIRRAWNALFPLAISTESVQDGGGFRNIIFLHHSTGDGLLREGRLRELLQSRGYEFWDHGYNHEGLRRPDGSRTKSMYEIPDLVPGRGKGGNTDPEGLALLFSQPSHGSPDNALGRLLQHSVIMVKSCFPNSAIRSEVQLEQLKQLYLQIRVSMDRHPERIFILLTTPPLHPKATTPEDARRAREMSRWLTSKGFLEGHPNLFVFDFFDCLADPDTGMLKVDYQIDHASDDSHPNALANRAISPRLVEFMDQSVKSYRAKNGQ